MATTLPLLGSGTVRGCCPLDCQDTCSWLAHVENGRVVRLEGAKDHPITRGALCAKVNDYQARTYAPDRLLQPLRRIGPKGSAEFEVITWDHALDAIADRLGTIVDEDGAESILPINYLGSMGVVQRRALMRVFHAMGASRFHGSVCGAAGNVVEAEGHPRGFDPEELIHARFVLMWGSNLLSTAHHAWQLIDRARKDHGARIVAIDPIRTRTAAACDEHVSIRPGTDAVLAAGLAHVMFAEDLVDLPFARGVTDDLDAYRASVVPWTPERVAAVTDVPKEVIVRLAREFGTARPAVIRCGVAPQQSSQGESVVRALSALAIIGGHWQQRGGGLFIETSPVMDERAASRPDLQPRPTRSLDIARLGEHLNSAVLEPPVRALVIWNMNPAVTQPDVAAVRRGLVRDDLFTVVIEHFMTDTARYADIVLPSTTQLEHFDVVGSWGHQYISANEPAIAPLGESKSHGEIARRLAAHLGLDDPALRESDEEIAASALPPQITLDMVRGPGFVKSPSPRPAFTVRVHLRDDIVVPERPDQGSLQLLTPKSHFFLNSTFGNMGRQRSAMGRPTLDIHPADAAARQVGDGDEVSIANDRGVVRAWARLTDTIHPGVVALPGKWWGSPDSTDAVTNLLTPSAWTPGGQPAYNDTFVEVCAVGVEHARAPWRQATEPSPHGRPETLRGRTNRPA